MSRLTQHRAGVPSARQPIKFKGFRNVYWRMQPDREKIIEMGVAAETFFTPMCDEPVNVRGRNPDRPSAKRRRKLTAEFEATCRHFERMLGLPFFSALAKQIAAHKFPKFKPVASL